MNYDAKEYVNALYALDNGWTGKGVLVGVLDTGVVPTALDLVGQLSPLSKDFGSIITTGTATDPNGNPIVTSSTPRNVLGDLNSDHGTAVASIIAGKIDGQGSEGYAPNAQIVDLRTDSLNTTTGVDALGSVAAQAALDYAGANNIKIVNRSSTSISADTGLQAAVARYAATGGLVINSAGNSSGANPDEYTAGNVTTANMAGWLFVVSVRVTDTSYTIATYSSQCGALAAICVAAPGDNVATRITVANPNGALGGFGGTSSAAPVVTALAADILSKWPQLTGQQAGQIIENTATNIGPAAIYGHGLVNYQAALSPINPILTASAAYNAPSSPVSTSVLVVPNAVGSKQILNSLKSVTILDQYGRNFNVDLSNHVVQPSAQDNHWLNRRLEVLSNGNSDSLNLPGISANYSFTKLRYGVGEHDFQTLMTSGQLSLYHGHNEFFANFNGSDAISRDLFGLAPTSDLVNAYGPQATTTMGIARYSEKGRLAFSLTNGVQNGMRVNAASISYAHNNTHLKLALLDENGAVFGTPTGSGGLQLANGDQTITGEVGQAVTIGTWTLNGYASLGATRLKINPNSLITGADTLITSRMGLTATGPAWGGRLSFGLAQPLSVISGNAQLSYGNSYDLASQSLDYGTTQASLANRVRYQMTAGYEKAIGDAHLRIGATKDINTGEARALMSFQRRL